MNDMTNLENFLFKQGYIAISINRSNVGHFEVVVLLNDQQLLLLVDTGASKTVLHIPILESLGISLNESNNCGGGLGTSRAAVNVGTIEKLTIGSLQIKTFPINAMDLSHPISTIEARGGKKIDGVLGADILGLGSAIIDYGESKLYLKKDNFSKYNL
jgi:hypothetical protein